MSVIYKMDMIETEGGEPIIVLVDAKPEHVRILGANLRDREMAIAQRVGVPAHHALWRIYKKSIMCKTVFVDNEIVAIFGVSGVFLGGLGRPWLVTSPFVEDYPMKLAFRYKSELRKMLKLFPTLEDWVCQDDDKTIKLLKIIGFIFEEPKPFGPNKAMFMRATLQRPAA